MIKFGSALVLLSLCSSAHADAVAAPGGGGAMGQVMVFGLLIVFMFWMMRNQNKKAKEQRTLIEKLEKGDEVVTSGGILGKIIRVSDNFFLVQLAEGVEIFVQKSMIATSVPKGTMKAI